MRPELLTARSFLLVLLLLLPSRSWSQSSPEPGMVEAAKKERALVWYTSISLEYSKAIAERFQRKYPFIKTEIIRSGTGPLLNKILNESRGGMHAWDVISGSAEMYIPLMQRQLLAAYRSAESNRYEDDMKDNEGYWTALYVNPYVLAFNTRLLKKEEVPKSYEDLLNVRWKGRKISIDTEDFALLSGLANAWGTDRALAYFKKLAAQDPVPQRGHTMRVNLTASGEYPLVIAFGAIAERMAHKKAPIDWVPLEPVVVRVSPIYTGRKAPNPNAARLFIDFALSQEGQEIIRDSSLIPARADVDPNPPRLMKGFKRVIERPESYIDMQKAVNLYQEIFKVR